MSPLCLGRPRFFALTRADSPGMRTGSKGDTRIVVVPDVRLDTLAAIYHPRKVTPATIEFVDPLVTGQQGARFVESSRRAHAGRRCPGARGAGVPASRGAASARQRDAIRDFYALNNELLLADLGVVENGSNASARISKKSAILSWTVNTPCSNAVRKRWSRSARCAV